ncbi:MAG: hypothetical protein DHS20C16_18120 [Phycisphaerae bacterium]|nr:MAG: hypothetical protein DHS20C16_18120 [Phycisphaerae bacterium]
MKKLLMFSLLLAWAVPASATVYTDTTGDTFAGVGGGGILDIASVEVTNTATEVSFAVTLVGDIAATNWGKYLVVIDSAAGGDTAGDPPPWNRNVSMASGMDYFVGSWADGTASDGAELYSYDGANWNLDEATYNVGDDISVSKTQFSTTITVPLAGIGVSLGGSFDFDVFSTGSNPGDGGIDSLGNPSENVSNWGEASAATPVTYVTPEPATLGLLAIGGMVALRRRRS